MLAKWVWRFSNEGDSLWKRVTGVRYGQLCSSLYWNWIGAQHPSFFTKAIASLFKDHSRVAWVLKEGTKVIIGDGTRARFWNDIRADSTDLKYSFSRIYALASIKEGTVSKFGFWEGDEWKLYFPLRREVFGWEQSQWDCFMSVLQCIKIQRGIKGVLAWSFHPTGLYTITSFSKAMEEQRSTSDEMNKFIWSIEIVSDSKVVVSWIKAEGIGSFKHVNNIYDCREHMRNHGETCSCFFRPPWLDE
ncbi:hypothetical protein Ddye_009903 [Dipteronia dyeriana]|uniref:Reverse transcriptase zinc-binding domain-containing protein n=1 Tax=Dipteronia dyeriana TaxID=168575 RepID=A0AAD9XC72_9ROSI|nr:hypothetical protein Ddye_009903 [Dipteronia dyeriana]